MYMCHLVMPYMDAVLHHQNLLHFVVKLLSLRTLLIADSTQKSWVLRPDQEYSVGRAKKNNDICIPNESVSRHHATIMPGMPRPLTSYFLSAMLTEC